MGSYEIIKALHMAESYRNVQVGLCKLTQEMITRKVDYLNKQNNEVNIPLNVLTVKERGTYTRFKLTYRHQN